MSRGRKKPSLRDLSNVDDLDPHIQDMLHELDNQSDRGAALIATAMVDVALARLMRCRIIHYKDVSEIVFKREGAPLSTFSSRIKVARAFGVIGQLTEEHLETVRRIRNQFAHSPLKIDFTNKLIADEIEKLLPDSSSWKSEWSVQRRRFIATCIFLLQGLMAAENEHINDTVQTWTK